VVSTGSTTEGVRVVSTGSTTEESVVSTGSTTECRRSTTEVLGKV